MDWFGINKSTIEPVEQRKTFLLWFLSLCTMISAGLNSISFSMYMLFPDFLQQSISAMENMAMFSSEQYMRVFEMYLSIKGWQYGLLIITEVFAFAGALVMLWRLNAIGFHLYVVGQIIGFCVQNFVIGGQMKMNSMSIFWTLMIILLYATQLRYMKPAFSSEVDELIEDEVTENEDEQTREQ